MSGIRFTRAGLRVCMVSTYLVFSCTNAWADRKIEPRGGRYAHALPALKEALASKGIDLRPVSLQSALEHTNLIVRQQALMALATLGTPNEVAAMKRLLSDAEISTRVVAIYSLDDLRKRYPAVESMASHPDLSSAARSAFSDAKSKWDKISTAKLLLEIADDPSGYPVVLDALTDPGSSMRAFACVNAQLFATRGIRDECGKEVDWVEPLSAIVRDKGLAEVTRSAAISVLYQIDRPQAKAALNGLAKSVNSPHLRSMITSLLASPKVSGVAPPPVFGGDG